MLSATLVLDGVALHTASKFATAASRQFVSKAADMFNHPLVNTRKQLVKVASAGKLALQEEFGAVSEVVGVSSKENTALGKVDNLAIKQKHFGFYNQYSNKPDSEIVRGINSINKQILEHKDKIKNPEKHIFDFKKLDSRQQQALINKKWPSDIQRQTEQKEILEKILRSRR